MYSIGIDLGGTFIKGGIIKNKTEIVYKTKIKTPEGRKSKDVIESINQFINVLKNIDIIRGEKCSSIGIGSPGTVDSKNGIVVYSNNFEWYSPVNLVEAINYEHRETVKIANDADAAALGEWLFSGGKVRNSVLITLGTGVGSGIILDGHLYTGDNPGSVEMGHMMIKSGGRKCTCGNRGCLEAYVSATGLIKSARYAGLSKYTEDINGKTITDLVRKGNSSAIAVFDTYLKHLSEGLTVINNIFRPDVIFVGGGVCESFDLMETKLKTYVSNYSFGGCNSHIPEIRRAECGNDAGIIGAANL